MNHPQERAMERYGIALTLADQQHGTTRDDPAPSPSAT